MLTFNPILRLKTRVIGGSSPGELRVRKELSGIEIWVLCRELSEVLRGAYIDKVYHLRDDVFVFKLRVKGAGKRELVIKPGMCFFLTKHVWEKPEKPSPVCMGFRKYLCGLKIEEISQYGLERIVKLKVVGKEEYALLIELFGKGNIVLLNGEGKIVQLLKQGKIGGREFKRGIKYTYPKHPPVNLVEGGAELIKREFLSDPKLTLAKALVRKLGIGPPYIDEICMGFNPSRKVGDLSEEEADLLISRLMSVRERLVKGDLKPVLYVDGGEPLDYSVFPLKSMEDKGYKAREYGRFNDLVDDYFTRLILRGWREEGEKEVSKLAVVVEKQRRLLSQYVKVAEENKKKADLIMTHINEVDEVINLVKSVKGSPKDKLKVIREKPVIGQIVKEIRDSKRLTLLLDGEEVEVDITKTASENAKEYYEKAKKYKKKAKGCEKAIKGLEKRLQEEVKAFRKDYTPAVARRKRWYERFRWGVTSDGFLVVAGVDAQSNELLVKRYMEDHDVFLHAEIYGGAHVIIKGGGKKVPEKDIKEAATIAASYSRAWKLRLTSVDVFYVKGERVKEKPPPGQYLPTGAFYVEGGRSYIRSVPLELCIGLLKDDGFTVFCGSEEAVKKRAIAFVKVTPGDERKEKVAKSIKEFFVSAAGKEGFLVEKQVSLDDVVRLLPGPCSRKLTRVIRGKEGAKGRHEQ